MELKDKIKKLWYKLIHHQTQVNQIGELTNTQGEFSETTKPTAKHRHNKNSTASVGEE